MHNLNVLIRSNVRSKEMIFHCDMFSSGGDLWGSRQSERSRVVLQHGGVHHSRLNEIELENGPNFMEELSHGKQFPHSL